LYPTKQQEVLLNKHFGCGRFVYNHFLDKRIQEYKNSKKSINQRDNEKELPILKKEHPWLKEVGSQSLQYAVECLQTAYDNFFRKVKQKSKGKKGFPRFKRRHDKQSFRIKQNIKIKDNKMYFPKFLSGINFVQDREFSGEIKFATISKNKVGQYFVSITVQKEILPLKQSSEVIAFDLNVKNIVDSNGNKIENLRPNKQYEQRIKFLSKNASRCKKGSNGRIKANRKLAKLHLKITNKREDYLHKLTHRIINENQVICVEDLSVESMLKKVSSDKREETRRQELNRHKDIADCGFRSFVDKLTYKAKWYGRELIKVGRYFPSSQLCNNCKYQNKELKPTDREWGCINCFEYNDRDHNAALNVLEEGLKHKTVGTTELAACPDVRPAFSGLLVGAETHPWVVHSLTPLTARETHHASASEATIYQILITKNSRRELFLSG
jgi:putative transposase